MKIKSVELPNRESLVWNDLYKFTMQWDVIMNFPNVKVKYEFIDRRNTEYPDGFGVELRKIVDGFRNRTLSKQRRKEFEAACPYLPSVYFDYLEGYRFDPSEVGIVQKGGKVTITIEGFWYRTILWEVPLLAAISELYFNMIGQSDDKVPIIKSLQKTGEKASLFHLNNIQFADFGTRRAKSAQHHANVVDTLSSVSYHTNFIGSSNVELGLYNGIKVVGTYAHEWVSGVASLNGYAHANKIAMDLWSKVYNGNLGIALTDTFTTDAFLIDFDSKYANLFTGVRHDSEDPFVFTDKIIDHYKKLGIDPTTKTIVYSDNLNPEMVLKLQDYRKNEIKKSYGIGTNLSNDIEGVKPLNIVIKLVEVNNLPAIKLSDSETKHIGDLKTIEFVKWQLEQRKNK